MKPRLPTGILLPATIVHTILSVLFFTCKAFFLFNNLLYSFIALTIPFNLILSIFFLAIWLIKNYRYAAFPLIALLCGANSIKETFNFSYKAPSEKCDFSVMSYNVGTFKLDRFSLSYGHDSIFYIDTTNTYRQNLWLDSVNADIVCFQEFYNNDSYVAENIIGKMIKRGYTYYYINPIVQDIFAGFFGVITFSKYPIIHADSIRYTEYRSLNRGVYTDIVKGKDTVRIINVHLHSMSIRISTSKYVKNPRKEFEITEDKLEKGFIERGKQVEKILEVVNKSPYPVVLCGDFNDVPYSYVYQKVKKKMENAFEKAGTGFGFTYNKRPFIIRIDNQFYGTGLKAVYYKTIPNHKSDHFPIEAGYVFK